MTLESRSPSAPIAGEAPVWEPAVANDAADQVAPVETAAGAAARTRPPARLNPKRANSTNVLLAIGAIVAMGGLGFAAGRFTTPATTSNGAGAGDGNGAPFAIGSGAPGGRGGFGGSAMVSGTVVSVGSDSFTVKLASGETITIATGSSTTYHSQATGASTDLTAGKTVLVQTTGGDFGPGPNANSSASPGAAASSGAQTRTATDVTITGS